MSGKQLHNESDDIRKTVNEDGIEFVRPDDMADGVEDSLNLYWNTFLPMFFERITYLMRKSMNDYMKDYGLNVMHANCLIALRLHDGLTLVKLSKFLDIDLSSANRASKALIEKKLVYDDRETPRSKKFSLHLTEKGKTIAIDVMRETNARINGYFEGVPKENIAIIRQTLLQILKNVDPGFSAYIDSSKYANPFYVYLMSNPYVDIGKLEGTLMSKFGDE